MVYVRLVARWPNLSSISTYMHVHLTWTWSQFANEDCFRFLALAFSNGVVTGLAYHLPLLNAFATGHWALRHTQRTQTHTQICFIFISFHREHWEEEEEEEDPVSPETMPLSSTGQDIQYGCRLSLSLDVHQCSVCCGPLCWYHCEAPACTAPPWFGTRVFHRSYCKDSTLLPPTYQESIVFE